jgi:hypothetical protein
MLIGCIGTSTEVDVHAVNAVASYHDETGMSMLHHRAKLNSSVTKLDTVSHLQERGAPKVSRFPFLW